MPDTQPKTPTEPDDSRPPIFSSWRDMYWFVLLFHALIIAIFYWFTKAYS